MSARDRFKWDITCPQCGQKGLFHMSEKDHPYIRNPDREVDKIEGEFEATVDKGVDVTVTCTKCKAKFSQLK
jgi:DNA-directed RNA polymerase subunit RPC12/RpoP